LITLDGVSEYLKQVPRILDIYQSINAHQRFRQDFSEHESSTVTLYLPLESSPCLPDNIYIWHTAHNLSIGACFIACFRRSSTTSHGRKYYLNKKQMLLFGPIPFISYFHFSFRWFQFKSYFQSISLKICYFQYLLISIHSFIFYFLGDIGYFKNFKDRIGIYTCFLLLILMEMDGEEGFG